MSCFFNSGAKVLQKIHLTNNKLVIFNKFKNFQQF